MNIALFGTVFMDIKGFSANTYDPVGRNVGYVKFVHGGVGRNVAENLGVLGMPVTLVSTLDDNAMGQDIIHRLEKNGICTSYLGKAPKDGMGMFLAVLDQDGELAGSISHAPDFSLLEALLDARGEEIIAKASHICLEIDLNESISRKVIQLANAMQKPIFALPGNLEVTRRNKDFLAGMECFICNDIEAVKLMEISFDCADVERMRTELVRFTERMRLRSMVVTMGEFGAVYYRRGMPEAMHHAVTPVKMVDSTGAGDAFFSGTVAGLVKGHDLGEAVAYGAKIAAYTIRSEESTCIGFTEQEERKVQEE